MECKILDRSFIGKNSSGDRIYENLIRVRTQNGIVDATVYSFGSVVFINNEDLDKIQYNIASNYGRAAIVEELEIAIIEEADICGSNSSK